MNLIIRNTLFIVFFAGWLIKGNSQTVHLNYPFDQSTYQGSSIHFSWSPVPGASFYNLQYSTDSLFGSFNAINNITSTDTLVLGLSNFQKYFWKVEANTTTWSAIRSFTLINPASFPHCNLWLAADSNVVLSGANINQWLDLSGNNNHATQAISASQPILVNSQINNKPIIRFDGVNDILDISNSALPVEDHSIFFVTKIANNAANKTLLARAYSTSGFYIRTTTTVDYFINSVGHSSTIPVNDNVYKILRVDYGSPARDIYINNNLAGNTTYPCCGGNINYSVNDAASIGALKSSLGATAWHLDGDIGEMIVYDTLLTFAQKQSIQNYLRFKYFPPANLGKDIVSNNFCFTTSISPGLEYTSYLWSTGETTPSIIPTEYGNYSVQVTDVLGNISFDTIQIFPPISFNQINDTIICLGSNLIWNTNYPQSGYSFLWSDGSVDSSLTISTPGNYFVRITDSLGCHFYSDTVNVNYSNFPNASLGNDTSLCSGNWLSLNMSGGSGSTYTWSTGSVDSVTQVTLSGLYWVIATNPFGCIAEDTISVTIVGVAPVASFNYNSLCQGDSASFTDASTAADPITQWNWNFGDFIGTSTNPNPNYLFSSPGNYQVNLTTTTNVGCSDDTLISITIMNRPVAAFGLVRNCDAGDAMFSDLSTSSFGPINSWFWDFGDPFSTSDTSILQNPTAFYTNSGIYPLQLRVENISGCKDTIIQSINILESGNAGFTVNKECAFNQLLFTNTSNITPPLGMAAYQWYFGTASNDSSQLIAPTFTYNSPGLYPVELISTATNGCKNIYIDTLDLTTYVIPDIALLTDTVCQNIPFNLLDNSLSQNTNINSWLWTINGDTVGNVSNVPINFSTSGLQSIGLVISSDSNCTGVITENLYVQAPPNASFVTNSAFGNIPFPTTFNFTGSGTISSYLWDFDDGFTGTDSLMVHTYQDSGVYNPFVIVTDPFGCTDTAIAQIEIRNPTYIFDIDITNLECVEQNGFITINGNITNFSNFELTSMDMIGWVQESQPILEQWAGPFAIGGLYPYQSSYSVQSSQDANICCLRIGSITTQYFDTIVNIVACIPLNSYEFNVFSPYPNPTSGVTSINIIVPVDDNIELTITDAQGQTTMSQSYAVIKGVNNISFDTINFASGVYTISVYYRTEAKFVRLLKL